LSIQKDSAQSKTKYLEKAKSELIDIYKEETPSTIIMMDVPKITIRNGDGQIDPAYPDYHVKVMIQLLQNIRSEYYLYQQLCESREQTCLTRWAFIVSLVTLLATIIGSII
jgi:hypothetical protein